MVDHAYMQQGRGYNAHFATQVYEGAYKVFADVAADLGPIKAQELSVGKGVEQWSFDTVQEFFAEHRRPHDRSDFMLLVSGQGRALSVSERDAGTFVSVTAPDRATIARISGVFENRADEFRIPPKPEPPKAEPRVFIGHGRSRQWRDLKDHLQDHHGYRVEAYETGARTGHTIRDILEAMLSASSFAVLVMTGEDETGDGGMRARQNVVHETGLFQGRLGFSRAIVLVEEGTEDYSNLQGIHQIRYSAGNIRETFGDVLATLRREFGSP